MSGPFPTGHLIVHSSPDHRKVVCDRCGDALSVAAPRPCTANALDEPCPGFRAVEGIRYGSTGNKWARRAETVLAALQCGQEMGARCIEVKTGLGAGALYPVLLRLEREGKVFSRWDDGPPPRRRLYSLAPISPNQERKDGD